MARKPKTAQPALEWARVRLVREPVENIYIAEPVLGPNGIERLFWSVVADGEMREHFVAIDLDSKGRPLSVRIVSIGHANSALVHPREVFGPALCIGATSIAVAHNHPSGDPEPSQEDLAITERLKHAGALLGVKLLDHVVCGTRGISVSLASRGCI